MCLQCLKQDSPDRGRVCFDTGANMLNLLPCAHCGKLARPRNFALEPSSESDNSDSDETDLETEKKIFQHTCVYCGHIIATHMFTFVIDYRRKIHKYSMYCKLCGKGVDQSQYDQPSKDPVSESSSDDDVDEWLATEQS